jgi:hypothetical protein
VIPIAVAIAIALNIYEAQIGVFKRVGYSNTALIMKELTQSQNDASILVFHSNAFRLDPQHVHHLMGVYNIPASRFKLTTKLDEVGHTRRDTIVVFKDDPIFRQQEFHDLCPDLNKDILVKMIQGYAP